MSESVTARPISLADIVLPPSRLSMRQDVEWCVVRVNGQWRRVRFHDYDEIFRLPGLYEVLFRDILDCDSPPVVRRLLEEALQEAEVSPEGLRILDLGAGNGMVGEVLADLGVRTLVAVDISESAARASRRDRKGLYEEYFVLDMTALGESDRRRLEAYRFNGLACVAALGFGDIPPRAFAEAFNLVSDGGWIAFNIKTEFLDGKTASGFAGLLRGLIRDGTLRLRAQERYRHRLATNGEPLYYTAMVGQNARDIPGIREGCAS